MLFCFFFKQKTAYAMRISDWSSDVCSSDLLIPATRSASLTQPDCASTARNRRVRAAVHPSSRTRSPGMKGLAATKLPSRLREGLAEGLFRSPPSPETAPDFPREPRSTSRAIAPRSEEHTSELQSLMRISYPVFCLKKKKT